MIYGAYGYNGEIISRYARLAGLEPVLAGRSEKKLRPLAHRLDLKYRAFGLDRPAELKYALADIDLVLHCAGPYSRTARPMLDACLETSTDYLDITGEVDVFETIFEKYHTGARNKGVLFLPGVGFDVVPSDCLALALKESLPDANNLELALQAELVPGAAAAKSMVEGFKQGNFRRQNGRLVKVPMAHKFKDISFINGVKPAMNIPWGDLATAYRSTGIENIIVFMALPVPLEPLKALINLAEPIVASDVVQNTLKQVIDNFIAGETEQQRQAHDEAIIWGRVTNARGDEKTMQVIMPHAIELTARAALASVERVLNRTEDQVGTYTPAMLFGADFVARLPGVELIKE